MTLRSSLAADVELGQRLVHGRRVALRAPGLQALDLLRCSTEASTVRIEPSPVESGEGSASVKALTPTTVCSPASMADRRLRFDLDQALLHVGRLDGGHRAAHVGDARHLRRAASAFSSSTLRAISRAAVEDVAVFQQVGLEGDDLLQAQRPLLVPRARQAERLVPRRQLHRAGAGVLAHHHRQHLEQDAVDVVLRLLLGEAERIHLHAVAEQPLLGVGDAVAVRA